MRPLILDGPTGTQLISRGYRPHPVLWTARAALDAPELLERIHLEYLDAGADVITANTFRTSGHACAKAGLSRESAKELTLATVALARGAVAKSASSGARLVAGSLAPLEDCYRPSLVPSDEVLAREHREMAGWLCEAGCDLILVETMGTAREALAAVRAARGAGAGRVAVSLITGADGAKLLSGEGLEAAALDCARAGAFAVLVNCVHAAVATRALEALQSLPARGITLGAYANSARMRARAGEAPEWEADFRPEERRAAEYAGIAVDWVTRLGAGIVGSCCGTSPAYTRALSGAF